MNEHGLPLPVIYACQFINLITQIYVYVGLANTINIYGVYMVFGQENHWMLGHIRCIYIHVWPPMYTRIMYFVYLRIITRSTHRSVGGSSGSLAPQRWVGIVKFYWSE